MDKHSEEYYGEVDKSKTIVVIGAGALGNTIAYYLAKQEFDVIVVDYDTVEKDNIPNTVYRPEDITYFKTESLQEILYPIEPKVFNYKVQDVVTRLPHENTVWIDCVDNLETRTFISEYCSAADITCLHAGVFAGQGSVIWNERYYPPTVQPEGPKDCEIPYSIGLCLSISGLTLHSLYVFLSTGSRDTLQLDLEKYTLDLH